MPWLSRGSVVPFKFHSKGRHHIPSQRHRVTNWRDYDAALRNRGSPTVWFTQEALAGRRAQPRKMPGGQVVYSHLAIETALTLRAGFRLALRLGEGLIGSIMQMLAIDLLVPDHTTLSRRARGLPVHKRVRIETGDLHLIVDSTGLKLRGAGEWLFEKHGTAKRRSWRKLHIGIDAGSGEIVAFDLTDKDVDDASQCANLYSQSPRRRLFVSPFLHFLRVFGLDRAASTSATTTVTGRDLIARNARRCGTHACRRHSWVRKAKAIAAGTKRLADNRVESFATPNLARPRSRISRAARAPLTFASLYLSSFQLWRSLRPATSVLEDNRIT